MRRESFRSSGSHCDRDCCRDIPPQNNSHPNTVTQGQVMSLILIVRIVMSLVT